MIHLDEASLNEYLDSALEPARRADVDSHLAACPTCADRLAQLRGLFTSLDALPREGARLERDLVSPVLALIQKRAPHPRRAPPALKPIIRLVFGLQALFAILALAIAIPFAAPVISPATLISTPQLPTFNLQPLISNPSTMLRTGLQPLISNLQSLFPEKLSILSLPDLPMFEITLCLAAVTLLWLIGNGILLRPASRVERG